MTWILLLCFLPIRETENSPQMTGAPGLDGQSLHIRPQRGTRLPNPRQHPKLLFPALHFLPIVVVSAAPLHDGARRAQQAQTGGNDLIAIRLNQRPRTGPELAEGEIRIERSGQFG